MPITTATPLTFSLGKVVRLPGGKTDAEMLMMAEIGLTHAKGKLLAMFDQTITNLSKLAQQGGDPEAVYRQALVISGLGAVVGHERVGRAGFLLCDWVKIAGGDPPAFQRGLALHVGAISLLRQAVARNETQVQVLSALETLARNHLEKAPSQAA